MAEKKETPAKGVVVVITWPTGEVAVNAADFDRSGYGGYTMQEAQSYRARNAAKRKLFQDLCHPDVPKAMTEYDVDRLWTAMEKNGYKMTVIAVGHKESA
jgi:hypothetical protein